MGAFDHRGKKTKVDIEEDNLLKIPCPKCDKSFQNQQGLSVHLLCVHPMVDHSLPDKRIFHREPAIISVVKTVLEKTVEIVANQVENCKPEYNTNIQANVNAEVINVEDPHSKPPKASMRGRGNHKRRSYSAVFKLEVIYERESGKTKSEFKGHLKIRPARKYKEICVELLKVFKEARRKGHRVDFNWIWSRNRIIRRKLTGSPNATIRQHVVVNFIKRKNIKMRAQQRNKSKPKAELRENLEIMFAIMR